MTELSPEIPSIHVERACRLQSTSKIFLAFALVIVAGVASAFLLLSLPSNDDFLRAIHDVRPKGSPWVHLALWPYCKYLYLNWQGRWVSYSLEAAILPRAQMTRFYPALVGSVTIFSLLGLLTVCRFFTRGASWWFSLACTGGLAAVLWAMMPSLAQTVHWFVGGVENMLVLAPAGMLLAGLMRFSARIPWMIVAGLVAIITTGIHEAYGAMLCIALAAGTLAAFWMGSANRMAWLVALIAAVVGLGIVVGAPGNRVRMDRDVAHRVRTPLVILKITALQFWNCSREWIFDPTLLAVSLFVAFSPGLEAARPVWLTARRVPWRLLIPATWLTMLAVGFFMPSYAFVDVMPGRTLSGNFIVFAMGWLVIVFLFTRRLEVRGVPGAGLTNPAAASVALLILSTSLVLGGNTVEGMRDLATRKVFRWHRSVEKRFAKLEKAKGQDEILTPLAASSRLFYSGEIGTDAEDWRNQPMANFFGARSVRVLPAAGKDPTALPAGETLDSSQNM